MAEKNLSITYGTVMRDLKTRKFAPIYILGGQESYYIDKISDYLAQNVLQPEERDFNQTIVYGSDVTSAQVADMALRYPMMSEHQVIIVKESQTLKNLDPLQKYFEKPQKSTILVFCHKNGKLDLRKKIYSVARKAGAVIFEGKKLYDRDLPGFIDTYLKLKGVTIEPKASQMVGDHVGSDLNRLTSELDKLMISLPKDEKRITADLVEKEVGVSKDFNIFELQKALAKKEIFKVNEIVTYFNKNPKSYPIYRLLPQLFSYFQNLLIVEYMPNRNNQNEVAAKLGLRGGWAAGDYMTGLRYYSLQKVILILEKIRDTDAKSKGIGNPNTDGGELLRELIFFILH
ncbi:MAG: DNA polymerase III subunit delta [Prevotella sp.]|jgi:DNA polymerase-3 subunit delta|nr:DNA polymerase III subunit delta [Prevotella sp.]MCH4182479.1 DNA polymerase III subunit delta [Prevotella sp.]MCH4211651.1 DNA polymerase III subunit delta [Prevotella sp.]MCH4240879.1 DNA polymerase III subunit delta [Prevotella sp.]